MNIHGLDNILQLSWWGSNVPIRVHAWLCFITSLWINLVVSVILITTPCYPVNQLGLHAVHMLDPGVWHMISSSTAWQWYSLPCTTLATPYLAFPTIETWCGLLHTMGSSCLCPQPHHPMKASLTAFIWVREFPLVGFQPAWLPRAWVWCI